MNTFSRVVAGTGAVAVLVLSGAGLASAAPVGPTPVPAAPADQAQPAAPADQAQPDTGGADPQGTGGHVSPQPGGTPVFLLPGVAAPLPDPTLGVPDVLRVAVTPLALLADVSGESGSQPTPQGAQAGPGSADG